MMTGTNQTSRKVLIKNNGPIMGLFLINGVFWSFYRFFVILDIIGDLGLKHRYLRPIMLLYWAKAFQKLFHEIS